MTRVEHVIILPVHHHTPLYTHLHVTNAHYSCKSYVILQSSKFKVMRAAWCDLMQQRAAGILLQHSTVILPRLSRQLPPMTDRCLPDESALVVWSCNGLPLSAKCGSSGAPAEGLYFQTETGAGPCCYDAGAPNDLDQHPGGLSLLNTCAIIPV